MATQLHPLRFKPVYKDYIWGGDKIIRLYNRQEPPGIYAESWEVSDRNDGMSVVINGDLAGKSLRDVVLAFGSDLLGTRVHAQAFPLLVKLIDSRERLSVQVHPDDDAAARHGGEAKTEMWYVLEAAPGAAVFAGLKPGVTRRDFEQAIRGTRLENALQTVPVEAGDAIFMPGGRVHALDAGCLILEVQQNSNTTYRIYDWGRVGHDGRPRETHLAEALRAIRWGDAGSSKAVPAPLPAAAPNVRRRIVECPYFRMERLELRAPWRPESDPGTFQVYFAAADALRLEWAGGRMAIPEGGTVLVPAALEVTAATDGAAACALRVIVP